jgi:hypothetical protein
VANPDKEISEIFVRVVVLHGPLLNVGSRRLLFSATCLAVLATSAVLLTRTAHRIEHASATGRVPFAAHAAPAPAVARIGQFQRARAARQPDLSSAAMLVAERYGLVAFSATPGAASDGWITEAAPLCTRAWLGHIESAISGSSVVTLARRAHIIETFPSWAPPGDVGATVLLSTGPGGAEGAIYVILVKDGGDYLVAAAQ